MNVIKHCFLIVSILTLNISEVSLKAQSIELDKHLGAENAKVVAREMGLYNNEALTKYVSDIGERLIAELDEPLFDYTFYVVDDAIPNAFATPGGYIYITRGILSLIVTEDELAGVMAHEIIHAQNRHSVKQMRNSILPRLLELPGRIVGQVINEDIGRLLTAPIETSNDLLLAKYSRMHETESDTEGIILASKAGYNPEAMKGILSRLSESMEILTNQKEQKGYFNDHPYTPDRLKNITKVASGLKWSEEAGIAMDFPQPLDSLLFGQNPEKGVFVENTFLHPTMNFSFQFPDNWQTQNEANSVNSINKKGNAAIFLSLDDASKTSEELAMKYIKGIEKDFRVKPITSKNYELNNLQGYLVSYKDDSEKKEMYIHTFWVKKDDIMFKIIGVGPKSADEELKKSLLSFHSLTQEEKDKITKKVMHIIPVQESESIADFCENNNSFLEPKYVAFINGIDLKTPLQKGSLVKVIVEEPYF